MINLKKIATRHVRSGILTRQNNTLDLENILTF